MWERSFDNQASREVRARHRAAGSITWDAEVVIGPGGVFPSVDVRPDGRAYAAWHAAAGTEVWGIEYQPSTDAWGLPELIHDVSGRVVEPVVAADNSSVLVLWEAGHYAEADIRARLKLD